MNVRLRPRFRLRVDLHEDAVMEVFKNDAQNAPCVIRLYTHQVEFSVFEKDRHFWSPFLNLIVEPREGETTLFGKYGPNVNVWTMFMAIYAVLGISGGFGLFLGLSQLQLDQTTTGLWITAATAATALVVYVAGRIGQRLAQPQMMIFHEYIENLFGERVLELADEND